MCFQQSIHLRCKDAFGYATFFFSSFRETCSIATNAADVSELQLRLTQQQLREKEEEYRRIEREKEDMESQLSEAEKKTRSLRKHLNGQQMQYQRLVCVCVCACVCVSLAQGLRSLVTTMWRVYGANGLFVCLFVCFYMVCFCCLCSEQRQLWSKVDQLKEELFKKVRCY